MSLPCGGGGGRVHAELSASPPSREALVSARRNFAQVAGASGTANEAEMARRDDRDEVVAELAAAGVNAAEVADVAEGLLEGAC